MKIDGIDHSRMTPRSLKNIAVHTASHWMPCIAMLFYGGVERQTYLRKMACCHFYLRLPTTK